MRPEITKMVSGQAYRLDGFAEFIISSAGSSFSATVEVQVQTPAESSVLPGEWILLDTLTPGPPLSYDVQAPFVRVNLTSGTAVFHLQKLEQASRRNTDLTQIRSSLKIVGVQNPITQIPDYTYATVALLNAASVPNGKFAFVLETKEYFERVAGAWVSRGASGGGGIAEIAIAYVSSTGNDSSAVIGRVGSPYATITAALTALNALSPRPFRPVVRVGIGTFAGPSLASVGVGAFTLEGAGSPGLNSLTTAPVDLIGGTILTSWPMFWNASYSHFRGFGVDASAGGEGFTLTNVPASHPLGTALMPGVVVDDVVGLGSGPSAAVHAVLLENMLDPIVSRVRGYSAYHAVAFKNRGGVYNQIVGGWADTSGNGVIIKADDYAGGIGGSLSDIYAHNGGGIHINAETAALTEVALSNVRTSSTSYDLKLTGTMAISKVTLGPAPDIAVIQSGTITEFNNLNTPSAGSTYTPNTVILKTPQTGFTAGSVKVERLPTGSNLYTPGQAASATDTLTLTASPNLVSVLDTSKNVISQALLDNGKLYQYTGLGQTIVAGTLFSDDFTRADGALGASWTILATGPAIVGNVAVGTNAGGQAQAIYSGAATEVSALVTKNAAILFRVQDVNNYYLFQRQDNGDVGAYKRVAGGYTLLLNVGAVAGSSMSLKATMVGSTLEFFINNVSQGSVVDTAFATGGAGIQTVNASVVGTLDTFLVRG